MNKGIWADAGEQKETRENYGIVDKREKIDDKPQKIDDKRKKIDDKPQRIDDKTTRFENLKYYSKWILIRR